MSVKGAWRAVVLIAKALVVVLYVTVGWVVGLILLARSVSGFARRLVRLRRALSPNLRCECGAEVPQYGAFTCGRCRARSLGWVWRCGMCGIWAGHMECPDCGMSVRNPVLGRPS